MLRIWGGSFWGGPNKSHKKESWLLHWGPLFRESTIDWRNVSPGSPYQQGSFPMCPKPQSASNSGALEVADV